MTRHAQSVNPRPFAGEVVIPQTPRIKLRLYTELIEERLEELAWGKTDLADNMARNFPEFAITVGQVYEALERPRQISAWFAKAMEWTLGMNLPPHCHYNVAKRGKRR